MVYAVHCANQGIAVTVAELTGDLASELAVKLEVRLKTLLARRPPWWRVFARRAWRAEQRRLLAFDVRIAAELLWAPDPASPPPDMTIANRMTKVVASRKARKDVVTSQGAIDLAVWTDASNGVPLYAPPLLHAQALAASQVDDD